LQKIIKERNNLISVIDSFESRITVFKGIVAPFDGIIVSLRAAITVIKSLPIPTAIIPPLSGGVGIPINIIIKYSDTLEKFTKLVDALEGDKAGVEGVVNNASSTLANLKSRLQSLDALIQECSKQSPDLSKIVSEAQPKENTGSEGTPKDAQGNIDPNYIHTNPTTGKTYTLAIQQDADSSKIAPKRYATAIDNRGIVVLKGPSSFSSSTQVLLDEIKFKIDNQLI